jgi:hypothetical protein
MLIGLTLLEKLLNMNLKSKTVKIFAGVVGFTMALSAVAIPAGAQTTDELNAQINSLLAMIAQLQAKLGQSGSTTGAGASVTFTKDLTIGSTGSEVTALQQWLASKGYLTMPAGAAFGYFGNLTKLALAKYQAEAGISPAAGYFGPMTRAKVNAMAGTTTGGTTTGGTTTGGSTGISTPGVEGTLTATASSAGIASTVYEGDSMVAILGAKLEAKTSDIAVQRVKLDLGTATTIYNKIYSKIYVTDGSNVLASVDLNSSNVVKEGSRYYVTITGFNLIVPKNTTKSLVIKADVRPSIDSTDLNSNYTVRFAANGIRGVDGAGIDQYSPANATDISKDMNVDADLTDSATLKLSLNTSSPKKADVVAASGSNEDELDKLTTLVFDVKAEKDEVTINDLFIEVAKTGSGAANASSTVYLYDGSTEIDNASVTSGIAYFSDVDYVVPKDTTKTLTVKIDVRSANATVANFVTTASSTGVVAENRIGDSLSASEISGTATGYQQGVRNVGPEVTLVSKSIVASGAPQGGSSNNLSTSTLSATFTIRVKAVGGDLMFGTAASGTPMFASSTTSFKVYRNGAYDGTLSSSATSTSFTTPSGVTTSGLTNSFTLSEGNSVDILVTFQILGRNTAGTALTSGLYSVGFEGLQYKANGGSYTTNFMAGEADWRTGDVSFP